MRQKIVRFMQGRYGVDTLSNFLVVAAFALIVVDLFVRNNFLYFAGMILLIYAYYRMFSKDYSRRYAENQWFLSKTARVRRVLNKEKGRMYIRKTHHIYSCPDCRQKIKIPRGKGKIEITCPKCSMRFIKRS